MKHKLTFDVEIPEDEYMQLTVKHLAEITETVTRQVKTMVKYRVDKIPAFFSNKNGIIRKRLENA